MITEAFRKIEYVTKGNLDMSKFKSIDPEAQKVLDGLKDEDKLVLRVKINSPIVLEAAAPLTVEGVKEVTKV